MVLSMEMLLCVHKAEPGTGCITAICYLAKALEYSNAVQHEIGCHRYCGSMEMIFFEGERLFGLT